VTSRTNIGFEYNGKSILAGNVLTGDKRNLPSEFLYTVGLDYEAHKKFTAMFDVLGRELGVTDRILPTTAMTPAGTPVDAFARGRVAIVNGAIGFKWNFSGPLLFGANLLFRMNEAGLRSKVAPLFTLSYARNPKA
jgi:hypothetical protein